MKARQTIEMLPEVETIHGDVSYVIRVTEKKETGFLGVCKSKEEAIKIVESMGTYVLENLKKNLDPTWTDIKIESEDLCYRIKVQKLGRIRNGSFDTYATVEVEIVQNISTPKKPAKRKPATFEELIQPFLCQNINYYNY